MIKALKYIQKNLVWTIPVSMGFGLIFGYLFDTSSLKQLIIPVTFIMVYPMVDKSHRFGQGYVRCLIILPVSVQTPQTGVD